MTLCRTFPSSCLYWEMNKEHVRVMRYVGNACAEWDFSVPSGQNNLISTLGTFLGMNAAGQTWSSTLCQSDRRMNSHKTWESHHETFGNGGQEGKCYFTYAEYRLLANHFCSRSAWSCSWIETRTHGLLRPFSSHCPSWAHIHIHCLN